MIQTPPKNMAAEEHGMGPRGLVLICRYTNCHILLEVSLADLKKKEDCILCPTEYVANMTFITALGSIVSLLSPVEKAIGGDKIAIFSNELNHASIIDGIRLAERQREVKVFIFEKGI